jgi:hypothetical protein
LTCHLNWLTYNAGSFSKQHRGGCEATIHKDTTW